MSVAPKLMQNIIAPASKLDSPEAFSSELDDSSSENRDKVDEVGLTPSKHARER